jgi:hypothetical protein
MTSFDKNFNLFKVFFLLIFIAIVGSIIFRASIIMSARKSGKTTYEIRVNSFKGSQDYITTEYTRDKETGCISFKDEFGVKQIVCNNYSISEY